MRGGFLICAKTQGSQVVKKLHLGSHLPDNFRAPTVPPPYPHAWRWLVGEGILHCEKVRVKYVLDCKLLPTFLQTAAQTRCEKQETGPKPGLLR